VGLHAGENNKESYFNTITGAWTCDFDTLGNANTIYGSQTCRLLRGWGNTVFGYRAGPNLVNGDRNVFIGYLAGFYETGSHKLYIDNRASDKTNAFIYGEFDDDSLWFNADVIINNSLDVNGTITTPGGMHIGGTFNPGTNNLIVDGNVGIGRNAVANKLEVGGTASKTTAGDWLANSDARLKTNIRDIENAIEIVEKLHPVKFNYTQEYIKNHKGIKNRDYYNFIAQEYQDVFPESVKGSGEYIDGDEDEILQLDSYNAQIVTIKAVQELIKQNQELRKENEEFKNRLTKIEKLLKKE